MTFVLLLPPHFREHLQMPHKKIAIFENILYLSDSKYKVNSVTFYDIKSSRLHFPKMCPFDSFAHASLGLVTSAQSQIQVRLFHSFLNQENQSLFGRKILKKLSYKR